MKAWTTPWTLARRELRSGVRGFRIFLACLALGVATIAGAGSLNEAIREGIRQDATRLLGGDIEARFTYQEAAPEQLARLEAAGAVTVSLEMRAMARRIEDHGKRTLVELKGVDAIYPLYGDVRTEPAFPLPDLFALKDGAWGAAADRNLLTRLGLSVGDVVMVGDAAYQIRAVLTREPDRVATVFAFGPRLLVSRASTFATGLVQPGSQIRHDYKVRTHQGIEPLALKAELDATWPDAGWRLRTPEDAAPGLQRFLGNMTLFLTLVGLTALLVGGIGVANGVKAFMDSKARTIAILKCLGGTNDVVFKVYFLQVGVLALLGIALGLAGGLVIPFFGAWALGDQLPVDARFGVYPLSLLLAAAYGALIAVTFALWPLARVRDIPGAALFRDMLAPASGRPSRGILTAIALSALALGVLTIASAYNRGLAGWFVGVSASALLLFRGVAVLVTRLAQRQSQHQAERRGHPGVRLALANLHRPGAATPSVTLSLGLGLTVLVTIALIEGNLRSQIGERIPAVAPTFFFIDIQPTQEERFRHLVATVPGASVVEMAPMVRGRVMKLAGTSVDQVQVAEDKKWAVQGDRAVTQAALPPEDSRISQGQWWPADYRGEPLVSVAEDVAQGLRLKLGDTITVNVLGREITGRIANLRQVDWASLRMNFAFVFSPGTLDGAPRTVLATVAASEAAEDAVELAITDALPNVSAIRIKHALEAVRQIMDQANAAIRATAFVTLLAGGLVLAGAVAAGHRRRVYESVVLKVLGATRGDLLKAFLIEYGILGAATGIIAAGLGTLASWAILVFIMHLEWTFLPSVALITVLVCVLLTLVVGFAGAWKALGAKASQHLRNE